MSTIQETAVPVCDRMTYATMMQNDIQCSQTLHYLNGSRKRKGTETGRQQRSTNPEGKAGSSPSPYEMPIPDFVIQLDAREIDQYAPLCYEDTIRHRLREAIGLREWEWSAGEPSSDEPEIDNEASGLSPSSSPAAQADTYQSRVKHFTYTRGEDPIFRGRRMRLGRGPFIVRMKGDFSDEVSKEDRNYVPEKEQLINVTLKGFLEVEMQSEAEAEPEQTVTENGLEYEYIEPEYDFRFD